MREVRDLTGRRVVPLILSVNRHNHDESLCQFDRGEAKHILIPAYVGVAIAVSISHIGSLGSRSQGLK